MGIHCCTKAFTSYTEGLSYDPPSSLSLSLLLNRAQTYLQLGLFEAASADAENILKLPDNATNEKALYRGAKAYYELRRFSDSSRVLDLLQAAHPENREALSLATRTGMRKLELNEGKHDWTSIIPDAKKTSPHLDIADFMGPIKISNSSLTARDDIKAGELILSIKAFDVLYPATECKEIRKAAVYDATRSMIGQAEGWRFTQKLAMKIYDNTGLAPALLELANGLKVYEDKPVNNMIDVVDGKHPVDMYVPQFSRIYKLSKLL